MTSLLANTRIMRKVLAVLLLLGTLTLGLTSALSLKVQSVDATYSVLVNEDLPATTQLIRMNRFATEIALIGYRTVAFSPGSAPAQAAPALIEAKHQQALASLSKALELDPHLKPRAEEIRGTVNGVHRLVSEAARLGLAGQTGAASAKLGQADAIVTKFGESMVALNSERVREGEERSAELSAAASAAVKISLITGLVGTLLGVALAFWIVRAGIVAPIAVLETRMRRLAEGDTASSVDGTERRDEVGEMARALQTFRNAAIEREQLTAAKEKADAEQKAVVQVVGEHLAAIAEGDLTQEITADFPADYEALKGSVNQAVVSLRTLSSPGWRPAQTRFALDRARSHRRQRISPGGPKAMRRALRKHRQPSCRWTDGSRPPPPLRARPSPERIRRSPPCPEAGSWPSRWSRPWAGSATVPVASTA